MNKQKELEEIFDKAQQPMMRKDFIKLILAWHKRQVDELLEGLEMKDREVAITCKRGCCDNMEEVKGYNHAVDELNQKLQALKKGLK